MKTSCGHEFKGQMILFITESQAKLDIFKEVLDHRWGCWAISKLTIPTDVKQDGKPNELGRGK